jgi:hypothetical protein
MNGAHTPTANPPKTTSAAAPAPVRAAAAVGTRPSAVATAPFVIQLQISPVPIDPQSVPYLEIFNLYTLYCDVRPENGVVRHALRLGFFKDGATARTVARYLSSYFGPTQIEQLGPAELAGGVHLKLVPLKDVGDSGRHAIIELSTPAPAARQNLPAPRTPARSPAHSPSLWSWLHKPLRGRGSS